MSAIYLKSAVRNFVLRGEAMHAARRSTLASQRKFLVWVARRHNQLGISYLRDAKEFAHG